MKKSNKYPGNAAQRCMSAQALAFQSFDCCFNLRKIRILELIFGVIYEVAQFDKGNNVVEVLYFM